MSGSPDLHTTWIAAYALGVAFAQPDWSVALAEISAVAARSPVSAAGALMHVASLQSADDHTRRRAVALLAAASQRLSADRDPVLEG